jgi:Flp pilus assembly protein TadD
MRWRKSVLCRALPLAIAGVCLLAGPSPAREGELSTAAGIQHYTDLVREHPRNASYENALGYYYYKAGNFQEAEAHYLKAIEIDGSCGVAHNNMGILFLHEKKPKEAEVHFRQAIELNPHYAKAQYNLAVALFRQRRYAEAAEAYLKARKIDSDYVSRRDDRKKMKKALAEAAEEGAHTEELKRVRQWFAPSY